MSKIIVNETQKIKWFDSFCIPSYKSNPLNNKCKYEDRKGNKYCGNILIADVSLLLSSTLICVATCVQHWMVN